MTNEEWLNSETAIAKSRKQYAHFDWRTDIDAQRDYISDPHNVATHGFYPFIHYEKNMSKFGTGGYKPKHRDICYAAHVDRCIYQYYSFQLNELYNQRLQNDGISSVPVAYRTDLHESNITISKRAFDFIRLQQECYVMIGDFTHFFDTLDHQYLKKQWCSLLGTEALPPDHYNVFKNVTRFSIWELKDLLELNGLDDTTVGRKTLNSKAKVLPKEKYKEYRSHIKRNNQPYGIPQGAPISALLANMYMLTADKRISDAVDTLEGMYIRYSDDFIIVLPAVDGKKALEDLLKIQENLHKVPNLKLEPNKTQYFHYNGRSVENCGKEVDINADSSKRFINFLGFTFDGKKVSIRQKTITKYYYRMHRKAHSIVVSGGVTPNGKHISCKKLYGKYSRKGMHVNRGNFLTYVERAGMIYGPDEAIDRDTKNHMQKIRKALSASPKSV